MKPILTVSKALFKQDSSGIDLRCNVVRAVPRLRHFSLDHLLDALAVFRPRPTAGPPAGSPL